MKKEILEAIEAQKMIEDYVRTSDESYVEFLKKWFKADEESVDNFKKINADFAKKIKK